MRLWACPLHPDYTVELYGDDWFPRYCNYGVLKQIGEGVILRPCGEEMMPDD